MEVGRQVLDRRTQGLFTVDWPQSKDAAGHSVSWTHGATDIPSATPELTATATSARSVRLPQGRWYFHRRTIGGQPGRTDKHVGPFVVP
ncbi:MAG: hypothetical protein M3401_18505 [Actinomycetota bacterium]|nr:hypothetical protein [Actinomycetota bacterium]